jgi:diguanylate cyclase (GGDEF)-like protein
MKMAQELLMYILIVIFAGLLSIFLSVYALLKIKDTPGGKYYILMTFMSAIFTFSYVFELASTSLEYMRFWLRIEYLALPFIPVFILLMCFEYIGQKLIQWFHYLLFVIPIITIFMHNTNDLHHLYYTSIDIRSDIPFPTLELEGGPWFYVHSIFVFVCIMISVIVLLMQLKKSLFRFRMQILFMVAGLLIPMIANYFYINGMSPYGIDLGPVSMSISFLFHGAALLSFKMFNVAPIARDTVFSKMKEGVIVLNQDDVIVDFNNAIQKIIPMLNTKTIGKTIVDVLAGKVQLADIISQEQECDYELYLNGDNLHFHIRFSPVLNKNNLQVGKIITFFDVTERVNMQEKLKQLASIDGLTQVFNRTFFLKKSQMIFETISRSGGNISVIMFDIDHFKNVNDTFGHDAGDVVLTHVARVAKECLRDSDIIGRYGGEEFIICMPDTRLHEAYELANTIRAKVSASKMTVNEKEVCVTSSFGISSALILVGDNSHSIHTLMPQADQALYVAKRNGRNCVQSYNQILQNVT